MKMKWDQEGLIYTLGSEKFRKSQIPEKSKLMNDEKLIDFFRSRASRMDIAHH